MKNLVYWIWLSLAVTPGSETFRKLIETFSDPKSIFDADGDAIARCIGSSSRDFDSLNCKDTERAEQILQFCEKKNVGILTYSDEAFPTSLYEINNPPVLLYYRGILPDFNKICMISMVGTRRLTDYGRRNAFVIGHDLAKAGAAIVSGMAIGIDGVSHAGAISAGGVNIAFLGSGIDVCYPEQHQKLAREIVKNGCVMTEYAPGTRPEGRNFPVRNRLIAGISCATVVIEGRERSGALITARCAKKYGKTVYALPGNVDNKTSEVTNLLIKNGAKLITAPDDIIRDLEFVYIGIINPFNLGQKLEVRMSDVLVQLGIACVAQSDDIFSTFPSKRKKRIEENEEAEDAPSGIDTPQTETEGTQVAESSLENLGFDKDTLNIYQRIPAGEDCSIESLVSGEYPLPKVMKALLKLEMGHFVVMLPGEMVRRKLK